LRAFSRDALLGAAGRRLGLCFGRHLTIHEYAQKIYECTHELSNCLFVDEIY
jgi:hypothetical protein